jgi:hypothetical protein
MINFTKIMHQIRAGFSSESELKYTQLASTAEAAVDTVKSVERLDKIKSKAKASSLTSKICKTFEQDMEDLLG